MCEHYQRQCSIIAPCCGVEYPCRLCHDIVENDEQIDWKKAHQIDRHKITKIKCNKCNTIQGKSNMCSECGEIFGNYYCEICSFYDDDLSKGLFHCNECGICRVGGQENFVHCKKCKTCVCKKGHKKNCVCLNIHEQCPVCFTDVFSARDNPQILKCGHVMHSECYQGFLENNNYKCPLCKKCVYNINVFNQIVEQQVATTIMHPDLVKDVSIHCNECNKESTAKFHIVAMKCQHCSSYNTEQN